MKNDLSQIIFYLDLKHVHKYGSAKFQPNPLFSSQQMATEHAESVAEEKKKKEQKKKLANPQGIPSGPPGTHHFFLSCLSPVYIYVDTRYVPAARYVHHHSGQ